MNLLGRIFGTLFWPLRMVAELLARMLPGLAKLTKISLAARIALLAFLFLAVAATTAFWIHLSGDEIAREEKWRTLYVVIPLVFVIPVCLYYGIKLLSVRSDSRFPDIDRAWAEGIADLQSLQIPLETTPLFLVLGTADRREADALMNAAGIATELPSSQDALAPLHWYATVDAVFLVVSDVGVMNRLTHSAALPASSGASPSLPSGPGQPTGTMVVGAPLDDPTEQPPALGPPPSLAASPGGGYATLEIDSGMMMPSPARVGSSSQKRNVAISSADMQREEERLEYLCQLIVAKRAPVCPLNGMLTLLPFEIVNLAGSQLQDALQNDVRTIRKATQLRFPVVALVGGMEGEPGFHELVRRVGADLARDQRFGKGFDHSHDPTSEQVLAAVRHACGAFEDWTYMLYQQEGGLNKPGNSALFSLLCKVRGKFTDLLVAILTSSFGSDADARRTEDDALMFAGCYFAATGPNVDRQAFVKGVFRKLIDLQGELSWSEAAYERDERYQSLSNIAIAVGLAGIGTMAYLWWRG